jgi:hypothetical protein
MRANLRKLSTQCGHRVKPRGMVYNEEGKHSRMIPDPASIRRNGPALCARLSSRYLITGLENIEER